MRHQETRRVECTNPTAWYELKTAISGYQRDQIADKQMAFMMPIAEVGKRRKRAMQPTDEKREIASIQRSAEANAYAMSVFIVAWSLPEKLGLETIKEEIYAHHADAILEAIDEIMEGQYGPQDNDDPLPLPLTE